VRNNDIEKQTEGQAWRVQPPITGGLRNWNRKHIICAQADPDLGRSTFSVFTKKANLSKKANPWTKRQPSFRLPRFRGGAK